MKKILLSVAFMMSLGVATVFAGTPDVNAKALESFKDQFPTAIETEWSSASDYYKVNFVYNDNHVSAYYSLEGEFLATLRHISSVNLPMLLQTSLKNNYSNYWISDLYELAKYDGISYYVTIENADQKIILKSTGSGWTVHKKTGKV
jgi:hypothetical protein